MRCPNDVMISVFDWLNVGDGDPSLSIILIAYPMKAAFRLMRPQNVANTDCQLYGIVVAEHPAAISVNLNIGIWNPAAFAFAICAPQPTCDICLPARINSDVITGLCLDRVGIRGLVVFDHADEEGRIVDHDGVPLPLVWK